MGWWSHNFPLGVDGGGLERLENTRVRRIRVALLLGAAKASRYLHIKCSCYQADTTRSHFAEMAAPKGTPRNQNPGAD